MKRIVVASIVMAILLVGLVVAAQEATLGLSPDDYALFSAANSTEVHSFGFDYAAQVMVEGLDTFAVKADVSGSGAIDKDAHGLAVSLNGSVLLGSTQNINPTAEVRWVDGKLYFNPGDRWQVREDAAQFATDLIGQIGTLNADPEVVGEWGVAGIEGMDAVLEAIKALPISSFLSAERLDDEAGAAHFQIKADLHGLMDTDAFVEVVAAFSSAQGSALNIINTRDELAEIVRANNTLFENMALTIDQYIGLEDSLVHRLALKLELPLEPEKIGYVDAPFKASVGLDVTFKDINQPQNIAVPDGAEVVDTFTLLPAPTLVSAGDGTTEYIFFETIGEGETFTQPFEAQEGDIVTITVRGLGFDFDPNTVVVGADGERLAENEDREAEVFGLGPYDAQIADFAVSEGGTYSAEVTEYDGAAGSFVLTITVKR